MPGCSDKISRMRLTDSRDIMSMTYIIESIMRDMSIIME